jgi:hypothetical protein
MKGRTVVDLPQLNHVSVPDKYPLPLQTDIVDSAQSKEFIAIVDATAFFHQFLVHPAYRDHFMIISHRGLELAKVALTEIPQFPLLTPNISWTSCFKVEPIIVEPSSTIFSFFRIPSRPSEALR